MGYSVCRTPEHREEVVNTLRDAAEVVERGWTQGTFARNAGGYEVQPTALYAVCWCALGAISRVTNEEPGLDEHATDALSEYINGAIGAWNDEPDRTAAEVAAAMRECADRVERGEL